jgi:hypothetical protein
MLFLQLENWIDDLSVSIAPSGWIGVSSFSIIEAVSMSGLLYVFTSNLTVHYFSNVSLLDVLLSKISDFNPLIGFSSNITSLDRIRSSHLVFVSYQIRK